MDTPAADGDRHGKALLVVPPGSQVEQWRVLKACIKAKHHMSWLVRCRLLAQMRSADRVRKCLLFEVERTYRGHHETDAFDPSRKWLFSPLRLLFTSLQGQNLNAKEIGWPFRLGLEGCIVDRSQPEMLQRRGADDNAIIALGV